MRAAGHDVETFSRSTTHAADSAGLSFGKLVGAISLSTIATNAATDAAAFLGNELRNSIKAASDMAETQSKVGVVFGTSADDIRAWGANAASALGMSQQKALEGAATIGNFAQALGLSRDEASKMSPAIIQLAADLASFNNESPEETLLALRSGLSGEAEPLRRFGVAINAATVETKALELGLAKTKAEISEADKVSARYALIMDQTKTAQGDFARTSDGLANSTRTLSANMENLRAKVGEGVAPALQEATSRLNDWIESDEGIQFTDDLATSMAGLTTQTTNAVGSIVALNREVRNLSGLSLPDWLALRGGAITPGTAGDIAEWLTGKIEGAGQQLADFLGVPQGGFFAPQEKGGRGAGITEAEAGVVPRSQWPQAPQSEADRIAAAMAGVPVTLQTSEEIAESKRRQFLAQVEIDAGAAKRAAEEMEKFTKSIGGAGGATDSFADRMAEAFEITQVRNLQLAHQVMEQAELAAAEATRRNAEAQEAAARSAGFFADYLQGLAGRNVRFAPGVFEGLARAGGMTPLGDLIAGGAVVTTTDLATGVTTPIDVAMP